VSFDAKAGSSILIIDDCLSFVNHEAEESAPFGCHVFSGENVEILSSSLYTLPRKVGLYKNARKIMQG
jgi:hypothetical protein